MAYLLDANVFIEAKNRHYGFDFCPAFWDWLAEAHEADKVFSIKKVREELEAGKDDLARWAKARARGFFLEPDSKVVASLETVANWVNNQGYSSAAIKAFLGSADYYLIAHAHAHGHTVVTHEVASDPHNPSLRRVKIPDVARASGVECITPFEMLRREGARFVLKRGPWNDGNVE